MALIELRRKIFPNNTGTGSQYIAQVIYYDTDPAVRTLYRTQLDSAVSNPAELAKDALVDTYQVRPGKSLEVRYNGSGSVYTKPSVNGTPSTLQVLLPLAPHYTSGPGLADAALDLTGRFGEPPYRLDVLGLTAGTGGYTATATSYSELYPVRFFNLRAGLYKLTVADALGAVATASMLITDGNGYGRAVLIYEESHNTATITTQWRFNELDIHQYNYPRKNPPTGIYQVPYGTLLDGYFLPGTTLTWRRVYSDGAYDVYYRDTVLSFGSELALDNLIAFHPDTPAEQNGGLLLEMRASHPPLTFTLRASRAIVATNQTGHFDGLRATSYTVQVVDRLGKSVTVPVELLDRYGLRWQLAYSDVADVPCRLEMWAAGYTGTVEPIFGQAKPVIIKTDGLNSSIGGQGDIGAVVATTAELNLKVTADTFEEIIGRDRYCRVDFYYDNKLAFRGFVLPDSYDAPMLPGLQPVRLTATDGLADLKDVFMSGHLNQRLYGRRPWLNTLLHCLSRTDIALPVRIFTNRREASMATTDAPELLATTDRTGYWEQEKNEPMFQRNTLEAVSQAAGGTLMQREGRWEIRNILEAATDTEGRTYRPAGTPVGTLTVVAPTATILPPTQGPLHWLEGDQVLNVRAGWKSLTGKTDVGWLKNAYPQGVVFSDKNAWLEDASQLQAINGWRPPVAQPFPLILSRLGDTGTDYATRWPRSQTLSTPDNRYLQGPPLPLAVGQESVPAAFTFAGRLVPSAYVPAADGTRLPAPLTAETLYLPFEVVIDGQGAGLQLAAFKAEAGKDTTVTVPAARLPAGTHSAELRVYAWYSTDPGLLSGPAAAPNVAAGQNYALGSLVRVIPSGLPDKLFVAIIDQAPGYLLQTLTYAGAWLEIPATNDRSGDFYLREVGVQLTPQNGTWEGEDNFRADGPGGRIRPTEPLAVFHPDVPLAAGLFGGNLPAFPRGVALADGTMSTSWRRAIDKDASPLFESNVYDGLALRDGQSRLLIGTLEHRGTTPPLLLDTLDAPFDAPGRRFAVCASSWDTKLARTEVSLVQNGVGASATNPYGNVRGKILITDTLYQWLPGQFVPYALGDSDGNMLSWD